MNASLRAQFPSLSRKVNGHPAIFLDGPAGTQVPEMVIDAISGYYKNSNSNTHGQFVTTHETDAVIEYARNQCATLLKAAGPECISFGQNMTSLCYSLSLGIGRMLQPKDEILITQLDHEANRGPWLSLQNRGIIVREINILANGTLDYEDAAHKINSKTRLVAAGFASNMLGTVNDIALLRKLSREAGAWLLVDAVHATPHFTVDVQSLDCDFLLCSAYKFYGPHVGILYSRPGLLDKIPVNRLRVQEQRSPYMIETGTLNHAALAGVSAAIDFIASLGDGDQLSSRLKNAFDHISSHEHSLGQRLWQGLMNIPSVQLYGVDFSTPQRAPTISFIIEGMTAADVCKLLGEQGIFAWDGHFYALRASEILDTLDKGGVIRMGVVAYNTVEEIDRVIEVLNSIAKSAATLSLQL